MSLTLFRFIQRLTTPVPVNAPIATGDSVDGALNKLQGQINNISTASSSQIPIHLPDNYTYIISSTGNGNQVLFVEEINIGMNSEISIDDDSILVEVI